MDLRNREQRLRRKAKSKGLFVEKIHWKVNDKKYFGYNIGIEKSRFIISGYHGSRSDALSLEQAEVFVEEYSTDS